MDRSVAPFSRSLQSSTDYGALNSAPLEALLSVVLPELAIFITHTLAYLHVMKHRHVRLWPSMVWAASNMTRLLSSFLMQGYHFVNRCTGEPKP